MPAFSINIIVKNQSLQLRRCLGSLTGLTDDVVVIIDPGTDMQVYPTARKYTSKVYFRHLDNFSTQRNYAVSKSRYDWILVLDADEIISPKLYRWLISFSKITNPGYSAYSIARKNIIFGRTINHTNWDPHGIVRIFDSNQGHWRGKVHETWFTTGSIGEINLPIIHTNYSSVEDFIDRLNLYTTREAEALSEFSYWYLFFDPCKEFIRRYIIHAGFLDGSHGFFLSILMVYYRLCVWIKVWQKKAVRN